VNNEASRVVSLYGLHLSVSHTQLRSQLLDHIISLALSLFPRVTVEKEKIIVNPVPNTLYRTFFETCIGDNSSKSHHNARARLSRVTHAATVVSCYIVQYTLVRASTVILSSFTILQSRRLQVKKFTFDIVRRYCYKRFFSVRFSRRDFALPLGFSSQSQEQQSP